MSSVLLKQSAEYRDAFNRFVFDGGNAATVTFDANTNGLFEPTKQYGIKQDPPLKAFETAAAQKVWGMSRTVTIPGVGTGSAATITFVSGLLQDVCKQVNFQLYGVDTIPSELLTLTTGASATATMAVGSTGRATGCVLTGVTSPDQYMFYSTLVEN